MKCRIGRFIRLQCGHEHQSSIVLPVASDADIPDNPDDLETLPLRIRREIYRASDNVTVHIEVTREAFAHQCDLCGVGQVGPCHIATAKDRNPDGRKEVWRDVLNRACGVDRRTGDEGYRLHNQLCWNGPEV